MPQGQAFRLQLDRRHRLGHIAQFVFLCATIVGVLGLATLLYDIIDQSFGLVAVRNETAPEELAVGGVPLDELAPEQLVAILQERVPVGVLRRLESEAPLVERSQRDLYDLVVERVVRPTVLASWSLSESLLRRAKIESATAEAYPDAVLSYRSWVNLAFLNRPQSSVPAQAGVRTALLGSLWIIGLTMLVAFPVGVGAAVYLEEYARDNWLNRIIQTNISNLAGVPSIIYGMLGLAIFVRAIEPVTSGALFGLSDPSSANGRTILSAAMTLALLVLPLLIINAQEAIRAVPRSLRQASYALGATRWQTTWHHVLPGALPGILTGTILAISRALGETAPLVVVGASTFVALDPSGPFSKFTTLPIQIYQWTSRPQSQFRNIAAAASLVLLVLVLVLNASAILLRNRYSGSNR
jgi:phosphate transport system permease protein